MKFLFCYTIACCACLCSAASAQAWQQYRPPAKTTRLAHDSLLPSFKYIRPTQNNNTNLSLRPDGYTQHFGFFCRQELKLEKQSRVPLHFRLGSIDYCDWLEGKASARSYNH